MRIPPGIVQALLTASLLHVAAATGGEPVSAAAGALRSSNPGTCNAAPRDPITWVDLPGHSPFQPLPTRDGCWIFVSLFSGNGPTAGVAVFRRDGGSITLARVVPLGEAAHGMALTRDERLLVVADGTQVVFVDVPRLISGHKEPVLGRWGDGNKRPGRVYVNISPDDHYLFMSDELVRTITLLDLEKATASGFAAEAAVGKIPVGYGPVALTFSPDGRYLYTTSQGMAPAADWPVECQWPTYPKPVAQGAIFVIDVERARTDPAKSVVAVAKAGCSPVRLVLSPDGAVAYVTARSENALLAFDTRKLLTDPDTALIGKVPTGLAPVGVAVFDEGRKVVVANSNRFAAGKASPQLLTVIDTQRIASGEVAVLGVIPASGVPREMRLSADQRTLFVVNTESRHLEMIDLSRLSNAMSSPPGP